MNQGAILPLFLLPVILSAQKAEVKQSVESIGGGKNNCLSVTVYGVTEGDVQKEWKNLLKDYNAEKVKGGGEIFADNASIASVSANTIDIYARTESRGKGEVRLVVGFDLGGAYLSSSKHPQSYNAAEKILYDFAMKMNRKGAEAEVAAAEKMLAQSEKNLEKLKKENDRFHQAIENAKKSIEKAESDIKANEEEQQKTKQEVEAKKKTLQELKEKVKRFE